MRTLIEDAWLDYERKVIPPNASQTQRVESRRAFYSGAIGLFCTITLGLDGSDTEPTEKDMSLFDDLQAEVTKYADDMKAGRA